MFLPWEGSPSTGMNSAAMQSVWLTEDRCVWRYPQCSVPLTPPTESTCAFRSPALARSPAYRYASYNDAYAKRLGEQHPAAFGVPAQQVYKEVRDAQRNSIVTTYAPQGLAPL